MGSVCCCLLAFVAASKPAVPLFEGLGKHTRKVATSRPLAQKYFDQGLMWMFAYNHEEAIRSFREAARIDPDCAMAYWGVALSRGVNINDPNFPPERAKVAWEALQKAREKAKGEVPANRALIAALSARYASPMPKDRVPLEKAYAARMKAAWEKFPRDADVGALYSESMMNLRPWDLWTLEGKPQPGTLEIVRTLKQVRKLAPDHPLANHLTIHALEASPEPGKADEAAGRLRGAYPGLGHLLHMPSHIDIRRGRWLEAIEANRLAMASDRKYLENARARGAYPFYMAHNHHMLAFAATMRGQSKLSLKMVREMVAGVPKDWLKEKGHAALVDGYVAMPLEVMKRFGRWDDILKEPQPAEQFPIARAMWRYARGVAYAARGDVAKARAEQKALRAAVKKVPAGATHSNNKAADLLAVADDMLEGEILLREGKMKEAIRAMRSAVGREDKLRYAEPPDWFVPARHALGAFLLRDRQHAAAEEVYREDLKRWPENGWSLHGLAASLEARGMTEEAARVKERFTRVWKDADVEIPSSCFCVRD